VKEKVSPEKRKSRRISKKLALPVSPFPSTWEGKNDEPFEEKVVSTAEYAAPSSTPCAEDLELVDYDEEGDLDPIKPSSKELNKEVSSNELKKKVSRMNTPTPPPSPGNGSDRSTKTDFSPPIPRKPKPTRFGGGDAPRMRYVDKRPPHIVAQHRHYSSEHTDTLSQRSSLSEKYLSSTSEMQKYAQYSAKRNRFIPTRESIDSRRGFRVSNKRIALYGTESIDLSAAELTARGCSINSNCARKVEEILISTFHYWRYWNSQKSGKRLKEENHPLTISWNHFVDWICEVGIDQVEAKIQEIEKNLPRILETRANSGKELNVRTQRPDRGYPRSTEYAVTKSLPRVDIRANVRDKYVEDDGDNTPPHESPYELLDSGLCTKCHPLNPQPEVVEKKHFEKEMEDLRKSLCDLDLECLGRSNNLERKLHDKCFDTLIDKVSEGKAHYPSVEGDDEEKSLQSQIDYLKEQVEDHKTVLNDYKVLLDSLEHRFEQKAVPTMKSTLNRVVKIEKRLDVDFGKKSTSSDDQRKT
jgi:hypothetical protein